MKSFSLTPTLTLKQRCIGMINKIELILTICYYQYRSNHLEMKQSQKSPINCIVEVFAQLKNGDVVEPIGSGKLFTKLADLLVAPDMEAYDWIRENVNSEFFNKYVVRVLYASPDRFARK